MATSRLQVIALALSFASGFAQAADKIPKQEGNSRFGIDMRQLDQGTLAYYWEVVPFGRDIATHPTYQHLQALDLENDWGRRSENYFVMFTKMAYVVNQDISFFRETRLNDLEYQRAICRKPGLRQVNVSTFSDPGTKTQPSSDFSLSVLETSNEVSAFGRSAESITAFDPELGAPQTLVIQRSDNFGPLLGMRTSKAARASFAYYPLGPNRTLVVNYSISFLYAVPPGFVGGVDRLRKEILASNLQMISAIERYSGR